MWRRVALVRPWGLHRKAAHDHRRLRAERVHPPDRAHLRPYSPPTGSAAPSWLHAPYDATGTARLRGEAKRLGGRPAPLPRTEPVRPPGGADLWPDAAAHGHAPPRLL